MSLHGDAAKEFIFQNDIITQLVAGGWRLGVSEQYNRDLALYPEDVLGFVKETQEAQWQKFCKLHPREPEQNFLERVATAAGIRPTPMPPTTRCAPSARWVCCATRLRDRGTRFSLCQFKPEHDLNPDTLARYARTGCVWCRSWSIALGDRGPSDRKPAAKPRAWRIDLVLFVNGLPVATLELKSEFKQAVDSAIKQYKTTRLPVDPVTKKPEPLLTFKRGALVHFAVSQYEVYMATRLEGEKTFFLPFNKGTHEAAPATMCRKMSIVTPPTICGTRCCCRTICSTFLRAMCTCRSKTRKSGKAASTKRKA